MLKGHQTISRYELWVTPHWFVFFYSYRVYDSTLIDSNLSIQDLGFIHQPVVEGYTKNASFAYVPRWLMPDRTARVCVIVWSNGCVPGESCFICRFSVGIYAGCIYDASRATNASFPKRIDFIFSAFPVMCFTVYQGWNCSRLKQYFVIHLVVGSNLIEKVIGLYGNSHILLLFCLWTRICFGGAVIGCWNRISINSWLQN